METINVIYEEIELLLYNKIDWSKLHSEMSDQERRFVHGLIRHYKPKRLLELGVSRGGGSVNLLNAVSDDDDASLTSIDRAENFYDNDDVRVGSDVALTFPELSDYKWKLFTGVDVSEIIESIGKTFDFAIIDTAHVHPVESLNFLCVLPYLCDDAVVVFHDISLFYRTGYLRKSLATRILISTLSTDKIFPAAKTTRFISKTEPVFNICALRVTLDLKRHISNTFLSLSLPWETYPIYDITNIRIHLRKHYTDKNIALFDEADCANLAWHMSGGKTHSVNGLISKLDMLDNDTVFYGAGVNMRYLLRLYHHNGIRFNHRIWDINATSIKRIEGLAVLLPDFTSKIRNLKVVIKIAVLPH